MKRAILFALLLAGCQTTNDRIALDDRQCQSYGVPIGSPGYVQCRMNLDTNRVRERAIYSGGIVGLVGAIKRANEE